MGLVAVNAQAEVLILKNQGSVTTSIVPGSPVYLPPDRYGQSYNIPAGTATVGETLDSPAAPQPQTNVQLTSTKDLAGYSSMASVTGSASATSIVSELNAVQSIPLNATESDVARSSSSLVTEFQVTTPTSVSVNGRVSVRTDTRKDVQCTLARRLADGSMEQVGSCVMTQWSQVLQPGQYVLTQAVSSWGDFTRDPVYAGPSGWSAVSLTFAEIPATVRGPAPTAAPGSVASGPFNVASVVVPKPTGFGRATVYYPSDAAEGPFATVVLAPDFAETQKQTGWLAPRLASWGFVVVAVDMRTPLDNTRSRSAQMASVLKQVAAWGAQAGSPLAGKADSARVGVVGHGMANPVDFALDAAALGANAPGFLMPLAPMVSGRDYSSVKVPLYLIGCTNDSFAPIKTNAQKILATVAGSGGTFLSGSHACTNVGASDANKASVVTEGVSRLKLILDQDVRFKQYIVN